MKFKKGLGWWGEGAEEARGNFPVEVKKLLNRLVVRGESVLVLRGGYVAVFDVCRVAPGWRLGA